MRRAGISEPASNCMLEREREREKEMREERERERYFEAVIGVVVNVEIGVIVANLKAPSHHFSLYGLATVMISLRKPESEGILVCLKFTQTASPFVLFAEGIDFTF